MDLFVSVNRGSMGLCFADLQRARAEIRASAHPVPGRARSACWSL
ncbi:MAG: hypothetical protein AAGC55_32505 [Myxococcota bacterium]